MDFPILSSKMKHAVYFNLHKHCLSLRNEKTRKVVSHCESVWFKDAEFKVSQAGRQRVLNQKKKNVHAVVRGEVLSIDNTQVMNLDGYSLIYYNPYIYKSFIEWNSEKPVKSAKSVVVVGKSVFAKDIEYV